MSISQNFPNTRPSLNLNFARSQTLDPRITFTRTTTGTRVGPDGLIEVIPADKPRFDFDPVTGECLGLLIEEKRINYIPYSEDISNVAWGRARILDVNTNNSIISPSGLSNIVEGIIPTNDNNTSYAHYINEVITGFTAAKNICCSLFVKKGKSKTARLAIYEESGNAHHTLIYDFETNTYTTSVSNEFTTGNGNIEGYSVIEYPNGWYRMWISGYPNETTTGRRFRIRLTDENGNTNFIGDETNPYLYVWGAQIEIGSFPTSYIPNDTGSQKTRNPDNVSITGTNFTDWYNQDEGTVYVSQKLRAVQDDGRNNLVYLINGGGVNENDYFYNTKQGTTNIFAFADGGTSYSRFQDGTDSTDTKTAWAYDVSGDDFKAYYNGIEATNESDSNTPSTTSHNQLELGATAGDKYCGHISQLTYYPVRLSNDQLITLTK